jgi:hypothetical protein
MAKEQYNTIQYNKNGKRTIQYNTIRMGKGQYNKEWTTTNIAGLTVSLDMLVL